MCLCSRMVAQNIGNARDLYVIYTMPREGENPRTCEHRDVLA